MIVGDSPGRAAVDDAARGDAPAGDMPPRLLNGGTLWREAGQEGKAAGLRAAFTQDGPADTLAPGPLLAALAEAALGDPARLGDDELAGALEAAGRLRNRAHYLHTLAVAELARRRAAQHEDDTAAGVPRHRRRAQFPDLELSGQLLIGRRHAGRLLDEASEITGRLPRTLAGMADGIIDPARAGAIAAATVCLSDAGAATVDAALAPTAHEARAETVARRAAALAMRLDPDAVTREREEARRTRQRTEARREQSGNASFSVREADTATVMAVEAAVGELARRLRDGGAEGTLDTLRAVAALDRLLDRDPLDRLAAPPPTPSGDEDHGFPAPPGGGTAQAGCSNEGADGQAEDECDFRSPPGTSAPEGRRVRFPALVNLIVPAATLLGWGSAPGQAGAWGLLDPQETRDVVRAASRDPRTRWCLTVVNGQGEAVAHACAAGRHPWNPPPPDAPQGTGDPPASAREPLTHLRAVRIQEFLASLGFTRGAVEPIVRGTCGHQHAEPGYAPSRKLRHLIRARSQTCTAPGCGGQSVHADQDHVIPFPAGATCECNLHTPCRAHHRAKQSPGWQVEMPEPGVLRWTLPSGRVRVTRPTVYSC